VEGATFSVTLEDHVSTGANRASASLMNLRNSLGQAKGGMEELAKSGLKVVGLHRVIDGVSTGLKGLASGVKHLNIKSMIEGAAAAVGGLSRALDLVVPGLGTITDAAIRTEGAIGGAIGGIIQSMFELSLQVYATNKSLEATFDALGVQGPASGKQTLDMLNQMATVLPISRDQLAQWVKQFEAMGITDLGQLRHQLDATSASLAILGTKGADTYIKLTERVEEAVEAHHGLQISEKTLRQLYEAGLNVDDVARKMGLSTKKLVSELKAGTADAQAFGNAMSASLVEKGKEPLQAMTNNLDVLKTKGMDVLSHLFDGVDATPIVNALRVLLDLGDQSEPSGRALKKNMTDAFNSIIRMIGSAITEAEIFFLQLEVNILELQIRLKPTIAMLEKIGLIEKAGPTHGINDMPKYRAPEHPYTLKAAAGDVGTSYVKSLGLAPLIGPVGAAGILLGSALQAGFRLAIQNDLDKSKAAGNDMAQSAIDGAKERAKAHSPSQVTYEMGVNLSQGMADGMRASAMIPERAGRQISGSAIGGMSNAISRAGGSGGGKGGTQIDKFEVNVTAPSGVTDAHQINVTALALALERFQLSSGR
jgi:hypothetical protein